MYRDVMLNRCAKLARGTWAFLGHTIVVISDKVHHQVTTRGEVDGSTI
jgi:hypothetical protein